MVALIDLAGQSFGRWVVLSRGPNSPQGAARWNCWCACGKTALVVGSTLRNGTSQSCGCTTIEATVRRSTKHGSATRGGVTRTYRIWLAMLNRCRNPRTPCWPHYGGRGITVCERWLVFADFLADMGEAPSGLTIERRDNDAGYFPANCIWATMTTQARNRRRQRNNTTGEPGIYRERGSRFRAMLSKRHLGCFATFDEAKAAREAAKLDYWV